MGNFIFPDFYMNSPRPIWYPDNNYDLKSIETTYDYPFPVTKPLKRIWKEFSRIGLIVGVDTSHNLRTNSHFTLLNKDNILELHSNKKLEFKLSVIGLLVSSPLYRGGYYINRLKSLCYKLFKLIRK